MDIYVIRREVTLLLVSFGSLKNSGERDYIWGSLLIDDIEHSLVSEFPSRRNFQGEMKLWREGLF